MPGSATVSFEPSLANPTGLPTGTVLMCLDEASAVQLDFSYIAGLTLDWQAATYQEIGVTSYTTPVLKPGCGTLLFGLTPCLQFCETRPHFMTVTASKV